MYDELNVFLTIAKSTSLAEAGRKLKLSTATVTRKLASLEQQMGVKLVERNNRGFKLTEAGHHCFQRCQNIPLIVGEMLDTLTRSKNALKGVLNISVATYSGYWEIIPKIVEFQKTYPNIILNIMKSNIFPDLIDDSFDIYVRYDEVSTRSLQSVVLTKHQMGVFASREYLADKKIPTIPQDLINYHCLTHLYNRHEGDEWSFLVDNKPYYHRIARQFSLNNAALVLEAMAAGSGLAYLPLHFIENNPQIKSGTIIRLLEQYWSQPKKVYMVFPREKFIHEKIKVFVDFINESYVNNP